jgi:hypothetical protein
MTSNTVPALAARLAAMLETATRDDGTEFIRPADNAEPELGRVMHAAHGHGEHLPDDYIYRFASDALEAIAQADEGAEDDAIQELEADCYTSDLTAWLASTNWRVSFLGDAVTDLGSTDGFDVLMAAQYTELQEVARLVLAELEEIAEEIADAETAEA